MLSHDEERSLAEMEARLRREDPALLALFEAPGGRAPGGMLARGLRVVAALAAVVALTGVVTVAIGPDLGGLVGALGLPLVGLYGWRQLGSCPAGPRR